MFAIHHQVGIKASPDRIFQALTTDEGLSKWWTNDTSGAGDVGAIIQFRFNGRGPDFLVTELVANKTVRWRHSGSTPEAWIGTEVLFQLQEDENQTFVRFIHSNWSESTDILAHCSTKWAVFLLSLKDYLEANQGRAFPYDVQISY
jgi:uncharacterized protein YndB with AHSA1/START domain